MIKKCIILFAATLLTGCSYLHIHKQEVVQGNVITASDVSRLHRGMSQAEVENIMGTPLLTNLFSPGRIEYVYTIQPGGQSMQEKRLTCLFERGRLVSYTQE